MRPSDFCSCFISHSSRDIAFARRLYDDLQRCGVRCWFAPENLTIGTRIRSSIDESIRLFDKLLLVLSREAILSRWVETEVKTAFERERLENRTVLFPIRVDDAVMDTKEAGQGIFGEPDKQATFPYDGGRALPEGLRQTAPRLESVIHRIGDRLSPARQIP
jgi:hypothetical protein